MGLDGMKKVLKTPKDKPLLTNKGKIPVSEQAKYIVSSR